MRYGLWASISFLCVLCDLLFNLPRPPIETCLDFPADFRIQARFHQRCRVSLTTTPEIAKPAPRPLDVPGLSCPCCGSQSFTQTDVLWDDLIASWDLAPHEIDYLNRQQGLACAGCTASLRSMTLAAGIMNACGYRGLFREFVKTKPGCRLTVLEVNPAGQLTRHLRKLTGHKLVRYPDFDMQAMPLADRTFDVVVHSDTLEHVPDPLQGLRECCRVLRPGGLCCYTVPLVVGRPSRTREGLAPAYHGSPENPEDCRVVTEYGDDLWRQPLAAGFCEVRLFALEYPTSIALVCQKQP
jgi:SAM-dependent methyltransferase